MALTARNVLEYATMHRLGGPASAYVPDIDIVNRAIFEFVGARAWKCLERNRKYLVARPNISATTGYSWLASTRSFYDLDATDFGLYTVVPGDTIKVIAQSVTTGPYVVTAKDATLNAITLESAFSDDLLTEALGFELDAARVALPDDFDALIHVESADSLNGKVLLVSPSELLDYRTQSTPQSSYTTWMSLSYNQLGAGTEPTPVMEIWPPPSELDGFEYVLAYRSRPAPVEDDDDLIALPEFCHGLILDLAAAIAQGMEAKEDIGMYVMQVLQGAVYKRTRRQDLVQQRRTGKPMKSAYGPKAPRLSFSESLTRSARFSID